VVSALLAAGSWALRTRRIRPFSAPGRAVRRLTDPVIRPIEGWILTRGGNPQQAPWWLVGISLVGGILLITVLQWLDATLGQAVFAARAGPRGLVRLAVYYAGQVILLALIVRVVASWFGVFRYHRWMRPVYLLTDWLVEPLRRVIPPIGMIDLTPLVAWLALRVVLGWLLRIL
jgi:YggT family protein